MALSGLTARQRAFIEAYNGNATQAAIAAGYSVRNADKIGPRLVGKSSIAAAIREREEKRRNELIANREERMITLTAIIRNHDETTKERIRAVDVLNRMTGEYLERVEVKQAEPVVFRWMD